MRKCELVIWSNISDKPLISNISSLNNEDELSKIKDRLNIELESDIICIADVGSWYGRSSGYKIIGKNISDCLSLSIECKEEWYIDNYDDLRCTLVHSFEGTSYYLYRVFKKNLSPKQIENFKNKIIENNFTQKDISTYTERIGPYIKNSDKSK